MTFLKIRATERELAAFEKEVWNTAAVQVIRLTEQEAAGTPLSVQKALWDRGIVGVVRSDTEGIQSESAWKLAKIVRGLLSSPLEQVSTYAESMYQLIKFQGQVGSSVVHNYTVANLYIERYRQVTGKTPMCMFEAGFGRDHLGQSFCCAVNGVRYSGVTPERGPGYSRHSFKSVLLSLGLRVIDPDAWCDQVIFEKKLEDAPVQGQFELVFSHVVLEHLYNPGGFVNRLAQIVKPGGYFLTDIDLSGHSYGSAPCDFMRLTEEEFKATDIGIGNRLKGEDWRALFELAGFDATYTVNMRMTVPQDIQNMYPGKDLSAVMVYFICKRRES
jgi:SAM-dependent methyltransferase